MINVKVLGPGCPNCQRVERRAVETLEMLAEEDSSLEATIQHVTEYSDIMQYPIAGTPALVIDEKVVCSGRVPRREEIAAWLKEVHGTATD